jgi:hypothetical protein
MEETIIPAENLRKERISLIETIANLRTELNFPPIEAEEFDLMYDAPIWVLKRYKADLSVYAEMKTTER